MRRLSLLFGLAWLAALSAHAQNGSGIFMGDDMVLRAGPPLQLSLNAHVTQFLYQPTSDHIAYVSVKDNGDTETTSVQYVTTRHPDPETLTLEKFAGALPDAETPTGDVYTASLMGWSSDGRYLVLWVEDYSNAQNNNSTDYYIADTAAQAFSVQMRHLPTLPTPEGYAGPSKFAWSPSQTRLLIAQEGGVQDKTGMSRTQVLGALYDPASGHMHVLQIPSEEDVVGWQDDAHLLLRNLEQPAHSADYFSYDVAMDIATPIPHVAAWPPVPQSKAIYYSPVSDTTPKAPGLTLETDSQSVADPQSASDPQNTAKAPIWTVWLRRPSAPKPMSAIAVAVVHDAGKPPVADPNDDYVSDPQAQWAPDGIAVAYLAHGDLFVTPLTESPATAYEKVALGEKLDCADEKMIIGSNMKQIGLGILEYTQDNGEKLPAAAGWQDAILPYVKDNSLFNYAGIPVNYAPPQDLAIADMAAPADTPLATADTPCAHIVLYADGHLKAFDRNGNQ